MKMNADYQIVPRQRSRSSSITPTPKEQRSPLRRRWNHPYEQYHQLIQLCFRIILYLIILYLCYLGFRNLTSEVEKEVQRSINDEKTKRETCESDYINNKCKTGEYPGLLEQCAEWEKCMKEEVMGDGKTTAGARLIAKLMNELIDPLSPKVVVFFTIIFAVAVYVANMD